MNLIGPSLPNDEWQPGVFSLTCGLSYEHIHRLVRAGLGLRRQTRRSPAGLDRGVAGWIPRRPGGSLPRLPWFGCGMVISDVFGARHTTPRLGWLLDPGRNPSVATALMLRQWWHPKKADIPYLKIRYTNYSKWKNFQSISSCCEQYIWHL